MVSKLQALHNEVLRIYCPVALFLSHLKKWESVLPGPSAPVLPGRKALVPCTATTLTSELTSQLNITL